MEPTSAQAHKYAMGSAFPLSAGAAPGYKVRLDIRRSKIDIVTALLFQALVENWCGRNCRYGWSVDNPDDTVMSVSFDDPRDVLIFQLTEEYDFFNRYSGDLLAA